MYFMRGAVDKFDMLDLTPFERQMFQEYINERLTSEFKKTSGYYVY